MRARMPLRCAALATALFLPCVTGIAQDADRTEIERQKQRVEALEHKIEQLERATREKVGASEEQIEKVAQKLAKDKEKPTDMSVSWKDGLTVESRDKQTKFHVGGRLHLDAGWFSQDGELYTARIPATNATIGDQKDGCEVRRLRLQTDGTLYGSMFFKVEADFAESKVAVKDAYVGVNELVPFATLQVGHFKEPFSLEELTSDNYVTFLERALPNAFAPSYNMGVQLSNSLLDGRATWAVGGFRQTDDAGKDQTAEGAYDVTARLTGLPFCNENGDRLMHLGASASVRLPSGAVSYSARPENHLASKFVDTGSMAADGVALANAEAALVLGPFSLQGEFMQALVDRTKQTADPAFWGAYAQASLFLTGEHRAYRKSAGVFDRVRPINSFGRTKDGNRGWGAWEVAVRYSHLDLNDYANDNSIQGGRLSDATAGINWYLNPNMRVMADYTYAMLADNGSQKGGSASLFGMRLQVDF